MFCSDSCYSNASEDELELPVAPTDYYIKTENTSEEQVDIIASGSTNNSSDTSNQKRGRGRPKGAKNKPKNGVSKVNRRLSIKKKPIEILLDAANKEDYDTVSPPPPRDIAPEKVDYTKSDTAKRLQTKHPNMNFLAFGTEKASQETISITPMITGSIWEVIYEKNNGTITVRTTSYSNRTISMYFDPIQYIKTGVCWNYTTETPMYNVSHRSCSIHDIADRGKWYVNVSGKLPVKSNVENICRETRSFRFADHENGGVSFSLYEGVTDRVISCYIYTTKNFDINTFNVEIFDTDQYVPPTDGDSLLQMEEGKYGPCSFTLKLPMNYNHHGEEYINTSWNDGTKLFLYN